MWVIRSTSQGHRLGLFPYLYLDQKTILSQRIVFNMIDVSLITEKRPLLILLTEGKVTGQNS